MDPNNQALDVGPFLKSLGFPNLRVHSPFNHFDFIRPQRRILVIGPMGSGKTEYSARVWRDSKVARNKSSQVAQRTTSQQADRREVMFIRNILDKERFKNYPEDALPFRGGYEHCPGRIAYVATSFDLEQLIKDYPTIGTWIIDEAAFYDERLAYVIARESKRRDLIFICPSLILNFRKEIFNSTAKLLLDHATDIFPLTAYCDQGHCIKDSHYSYRYYLVDKQECPALYFDPLIIVGGDTEKQDPKEPNYCTRCDEHHHLPGKEYTFMTLKPLGEQATRGDTEPLIKELTALHNAMNSSLLYEHFQQRLEKEEYTDIMLSALHVPCIAEKAIIFLFAEQNLLSSDLVRSFANKLHLDLEYLQKRLHDNRRTIEF